MAQRAAALQDLLHDSLRDELTPASRGKLGKGFQHLTRKQTPARLGEAAKDLRKENVIPAVGKQKGAVADLKELADIVSNGQRLAALPSEASSETRHEDTERLLNDQKQLRERIEQMEPSEFNEAALDAQVAQLNLAQRADEMAPRPGPRAEEKQPDSSPPGAPAKPSSPPSAAEKKSPTPEAPPEATAKSKRKGAGSGEGEKPKPFPMAGKSNQGPSTEMKKAADALAQQQQAAAAAAMRAAEVQLAAALPAAQGQAQSGQGQGKGEMGQGQEGEGGKGEAKVAGRGKPGGRGRTPSRGSQGAFSPGNVAGELPEETRSTWQPLSQRERRAMNENFARELPQEYREMLKAYYEFLSKQ